MFLQEYLATYITSHGLATSTQAQLKSTVRILERWHGRSVTLADFSDDFVNRFLAYVESTGVTKRRVRGQRCNLLMLWRAAYDERLLDVGPQRVRRIKLPPLIVEAWTVDEVAKLLAACDKLEGRFCNTRLSRRLFFRALVLVAWETGLRLGDLLTVRRDQLKPDGHLTLIQQKTGTLLHCQLSADAVEACKAIWTPIDVELLPWPGGRNHFYYHFRQLAAAAGLKGTSKKLRKSGATAVESQLPGGAKGYLGHKTSGLAERHYIDHSLVQRHRPSPPRLTG